MWQGHADGFVFSVAVFPDGQRVVSGGSDKTVRIWNMTDGALLHNFTVSPCNNATVCTSLDMSTELVIIIHT